MNGPRRKSSVEDWFEGAELLLQVVVALIVACSVSVGVYAFTNQLSTPIALIACAISFIPGFILGWLIYKAKWLIRNFFDS